MKNLQLGRNNPLHQHMLEDDRLENNLVEKDLGFLVNAKLNMRQHCVLAGKANSILWLNYKMR